MKTKAARLLNERPGWLGLSIWDLGAIGYILILSHGILRPFGLEILAFLVAGVAFIVLLQIRLRSRPKTIRDFLRSKIASKRLN